MKIYVGILGERIVKIGNRQKAAAETVLDATGRYVSPDLYLGIRQPVSLHRTSGEASDRMSDQELEVELQALRWLLLNLQAGGRSGVEFFVRSRVSYE